MSELSDAAAKVHSEQERIRELEVAVHYLQRQFRSLESRLADLEAAGAKEKYRGSVPHIVRPDGATIPWDIIDQAERDYWLRWFADNPSG